MSIESIPYNCLGIPGTASSRLDLNGGFNPKVVNVLELLDGSISNSLPLCRYSQEITSLSCQYPHLTHAAYRLAYKIQEENLPINLVIGQSQGAAIALMLGLIYPPIGNILLTSAPIEQMSMPTLIS